MECWFFFGKCSKNVLNLKKNPAQANMLAPEEKHHLILKNIRFHFDLFNPLLFPMYKVNWIY